MAEIEESLRRLTKALEDAGHPLAIRRPAGCAADALAAAGHRYLGRELPLELLVLWTWWGGVEFWPAEVDPPRTPFGDHLPGGVTIESLEAASVRRDDLQHAELLPPGDSGLVPIAYLGDIVGHVWCDLDGVIGGCVPVAVHYLEEPPPDEPHWTFPSISSWVNAMAEMLESGVWTFAEDSSWHAASTEKLWSL